MSKVYEFAPPGIEKETDPGSPFVQIIEVDPETVAKGDDFFLERLQRLGYAALCPAATLDSLPKLALEDKSLDYSLVLRRQLIESEQGRGPGSSFRAQYMDRPVSTGMNPRNNEKLGPPKPVRKVVGFGFGRQRSVDGRVVSELGPIIVDGSIAVKGIGLAIFRSMLEEVDESADLLVKSMGFNREAIRVLGALNFKPVRFKEVQYLGQPQNIVDFQGPPAVELKRAIDARLSWIKAAANGGE